MAKTLPSDAPGQHANLVGAGALAGVLSALAFTAVHHVLISPIWFALPAMLVAGGLCGLCLAWSYSLLVTTPTVWSWLRYNAFFVGMFVALGLTSIASFRPVTTIAALLQARTPPNALIAQAFPMTGAFTLAVAALLWVLYRPGSRGAFALLVTTCVLVLLLGLNISVLGLVSVPRSEWGVLLEVLLLLVSLGAVYAGLVVAMRRRRFALSGSNLRVGGSP